MDMQGVLEETQRMVDIVAAGLASGKIVEGHARGLTGERLQGYMAAGICSDHELNSAEDALEKLRAGMTVELRGSHDYVLLPVVEALNKLPAIPQTLTVCTDDIFPDYLVAKGGVGDTVRRLIRYGLDPVQAIRCATLNSAMHLARRDLGLVAAGRRADLMVLSDLREIAVAEVYAQGRHVASGGKLVEPVTRANVAPPKNTVKLAPMAPGDFRVPVAGAADGRAVVRAISGARFAKWLELEVEVKDGHAVVPEGFAVMVATHRHGRIPATPQAVILHDWGTWRGALATTLSHDSHNLVVFGCDPVDMAAAANAVIAAGGGLAVAKNGAVTALAALPVAGLLSEEPPEQVAAALARVQAAADEVAEWKPPYRVFRACTGSCLACNPGPHLTDLGLTDGTTKKIVPTLVCAAA
jgi:adenine deaminase